MIGATEAQVRIPNPSWAFFAVEKPMPIESTNGTVTGPEVRNSVKRDLIRSQKRPTLNGIPVVTPAESHAMLVKFSLAKTVRRHDRVSGFGFRGWDRFMCEVFARKHCEKAR